MNLLHHGHTALSAYLKTRYGLSSWLFLRIRGVSARPYKIEMIQNLDVGVFKWKV